MRLYCHCLNVNIDVLETNDDQETLTQFVPVDLVQFVNTSHEWIVCDVPSEQSAHIVWQSLVQTLPVREMKLNRCLGCDLYTHVTNIGPSRMLINKDLIDDRTIQSLYNDPNYSKIAKIILPSAMNSPIMTRYSGSQDDNIQREAELAQQIYRQSIEDLERDTEEKIRTFQRDQEKQLEAQTEDLNKELDTFLSLMRSVSRHSSGTKPSPTLQTSSSYINENSTESGFGSDIFDIGATDFGRHSSNIERPFSERNTNIDEETIDDPMLDNRSWYNDNNSLSNFATSLPKTIACRPSSTYAIPQQEDEDQDDLERIGKSFRDLSRSMCTDGTELFGDLPSHRLSARHT